MLKQANIVFLIVMLLFPVGVFAANPAIIFVFDGSGSMCLEIDGKPKIELAKKAMEEMLKDFPAGVDIGLVAYGHRVIGDCDDIELLAPLGSSRADVIKAVASIVDPRGNTPLAQSIKFAAEQLKGRDSASSIIVISDGKENCNADPCEVAAAITATGIDLKVHVVGFDVKQDEAEQLRCIAGNGGGKYFAANNASELANSFAELRKEVVEVKEPEPEPTAKVIFRDDFDDDFLSEKWEVRNQDTDTMVLDGGSLHMVSGTGNVPNENLQNLTMYTDAQSMPKNWNIVTKFSTDIVNYPLYSTPTSQVGIVLYLDKNNLMEILLRGRGDQRVAEFNKLAKGKWLPDYDISMGGRNTEQLTYYLKIEKRGFSYTASISNDGQKWKKIGTHKYLAKKFLPGLYARRHEGGAETTTSFDWFEIQAVE